MQIDLWFGDEVHPRRKPKPASKFDSRPILLVPDVSLIMDKPPTVNKMENNLSDNVPEIRSTIPRDSTHNPSESYAAWKEKQFPHQSSSTPPNRSHQVHSPVPGSGNSQNFHGSRPSLKLYNTTDRADYYCRSEGSGDESPKRYGNLRSSGQTENPNKYTLSYARNVNTNDHHANACSHTPRSHCRDNSASPITRRLPDQLTETEIYEARYNRSPLNRRRVGHIREEESHSGRQRSNSNDRRILKHLQDIDNVGQYTSPNNRKRSDYSHAIEAYDIKQQTNSHSRRHSDHPHSSDAYDNRHKSKLQRSSSYSDADPSICRSVKYNQERSHQYTGCCTANHSTTHISETETVKNLLSIITSQNEQIKNLQKQVERLLKLHENSLKDQNQCTCQQNGIVYQNAQTYDQIQTGNVPIKHSNLIKENEKYFPELKLQDEKNKQTFVEQKVSIGVMTSFELKVQNNPSLLNDNDIRQKNNTDKILPGFETKNMIKNLVNDTEEMLRKKPHFFQATPLENISEGSESHMSSLRQSHLCSDSIRQSIEAHDSLEVQNSNFYKQNFQEYEKMTQNKELTSNNQSEDKREKRPTNLDYDTREPAYKKNNDVQEKPYRKHNPYDPSSSEDEELPMQKTNRYNLKPITADISKMKSTGCDNIADDRLSLSSSEFDVEEPSPPSPEPSIHLDMQEYSESGSLPPQKAQKVGWTLYNNVLDQVNQILQNSPMNDGPDEESSNGTKSNERREYDNNVIMDTVKAATLEQLTKLGISFSENMDKREPNYNKRVMFDASYYARQASEACIATASGGSETSMHMKALAKKYLKEEQLMDMAIQKQRTSGLKQSSNNVPNSNMSFATMRYLQRYHLLPGNNPESAKDIMKEEYKALPAPVMNERLAAKAAENEPSPNKYPISGNSKVSCPSKILDISTLKQQPKLL